MLKMSKTSKTSDTSNTSRSSYDHERQDEKEPDVHFDSETSSVNFMDKYSDVLLQGRFGWFWRFSRWIDSFGEARGIERQPPHVRGKGDLRQYSKLALIWVGAAGGLPSMTGFFLGPLLFNLGFRDSMSAGISGVFFGCLFAASGAVMGPRSGLRSMVGARFQFGWWPAKFIALLNILTLLGWTVINLVLGGQLLVALNHKIPLDIGILVVTIGSLIPALFGFNYVVLFDKFFVIPSIIVFVLVYICTGSEYAVSLQSVGASQDIIGNWITFFTTCVGITSPWVALVADYFVDLPEESNPVSVYVFSLFSIFLPTALIGGIGIGIASAAQAGNEAWMAAYTEGSTGGLLRVSVSKWHGGGTFLVVIMFITLMTNNIISTYSMALSAQVFGHVWTKTPRYILSIIIAVIYFVLAVAGRNKLKEILSSFLPMISYWSIIYATIVAIESWIVRAKKVNEYQWRFYDDPRHFPWMWAAVISFCCGVAGCVLGMDQTYYVGVLARKVGVDGADLGAFLACGFTLVSYPILRAIEVSIRKDKPLKP